MVEQRQVAADAIALARIILGRFTDVGSIGAIANVRRSTWVDAGQVLACLFRIVSTS